MDDMGHISKVADKMPKWAQLILVVLGLAAFVYGIVHEGWTFFFKAIFRPEL
jgi:uncharacterized membrane protein